MNLKKIYIYSELISNCHAIGMPGGRTIYSENSGRDYYWDGKDVL